MTIDPFAVLHHLQIWQRDREQEPRPGQVRLHALSLLQPRLLDEHPRQRDHRLSGTETVLQQMQLRLRW